MITHDRVVYRRDGTLYAFDSTKRQVLWKKSAPSRFAVNTTTVFALQGFDLSSGKVLWSTRTIPQADALYSVGSSVIASSKTRSKAFESRSGTRRWTRQGSIPEALSVVANRFWIYRSNFLSFVHVQPSEAVDLMTGQVMGFTQPSGWTTKPPSSLGNGIDVAVTLTHRTNDGTEFVEVQQNEATGLTDASVERYRVEIAIYDARAWLIDPLRPPLLKTSLGAMSVGPREGCQADQGVKLNLDLPEFLAASASFVWLRSFDSCGEYIAQISRQAPATVTPLKLPLTAAQRELIFGESAALAALRAASDIRWSTQIGEKLYAVHNDATLEVLASRADKQVALYRLSPAVAKGVISSVGHSLVIRSDTVNTYRFTLYRLP